MSESVSAWLFFGTLSRYLEDKGFLSIFAFNEW